MSNCNECPYCEIDELREALDACAVDNEQYKQANDELNAEIERLRAEVVRQDQFIQHLLGECPDNCKDCGE